MKWKAVLRQYAGITLGTLITALGLNLFLIPNKIAAGGVSGLATIVYFVAGWPVGLTILAINIPLFLLGLKVLGARYGVGTLYGAVALAVGIEVTAPLVPVLTRDFLLASLYGGVVTGIGLGLVFRFRGNTAGTMLLAAIISKLYGIRVGQSLLIADFLVIVLAGVAFKSPELAMYALITIFVTAQIIDLVQEGPSTAKAFIIMTEAPQKVGDAILYELDRGVTYLNGRGGYTNQERDLLLCVVAMDEVTALKEMVVKHDPRAFVIVTDAHEVMGEGFTPWKIPAAKKSKEEQS